jgi:prolycopene isomerase
MSKAIVVGSGLAGLTTAAYLAKAGVAVTVYEQGDVIGGVTRTVARDGFQWDIGPLGIEGMFPDNPGGIVVSELGCAGRIPLAPMDRSVSFPDFEVFRPPAYGGPAWRTDRLKQIFPEEAAAIDRFQKLVDTITDLVALERRSAVTDGLPSALLKIGMLAKYLPIKKYETWSAERLMNHYFKNEKLKAFFAGILADLAVKPSEFIGLGLGFFNMDCFMESRIPSTKVLGLAPRLSYGLVTGGIKNLSGPIADTLRELGGKIVTKTAVRRILTEHERAVGVELSDGSVKRANLVLVSGGARECFFDMVGKDRLPAEFTARIEAIRYMESVFMVQIGTGQDVTAHQDRPLVYYYNTYDIEHSVQELREGRYHEGSDGFLIFINTMLSPDMAPKGKHSVTIYTVAPNALSGGWEDRREQMTVKLLDHAERRIPGLRKNADVIWSLTPDDFKKIVHTPRQHSFGGICPVMGHPGAPHKTPYRGLWFIGSQSESGAGMLNQLVSARKVAKMIVKER